MAAGAAAGAFNWGNFGAAGLGAVGNVLGGYFEGQGQKAGMEALARANKDAAFKGFMGSTMKLNDERAARAGQYAQNVFGQLSGSLYSAPSNFMWQRLAEKEKYNDLIPRQFAMAREESRLGEEQEQTPLFKKGREDAARMDRFAGRYAAALPAMTQYGQFNLPNV